MKKELTTLNSLRSVEQFVFSDVSSPSSHIYAELDCQEISCEQQKTVETFFRLNHAKEEVKQINLEAKLLFQYLHEQSEAMLTELNHLMDNSDRVSKGKVMFLHHHHLIVENMWEACAPLLAKVNSDVYIPQVVNNMVINEVTELQSGVSVQGEEINSVLLSDIMENIEYYENEGHDLSVSDDGDDDDDDCDDDDDDCDDDDCGGEVQ